MKLADARPGDILQGRDGAVWLRGTVNVWCLYTPDDELDGDGESLGAIPIDIPAAEHFGPFTRLVPEKETP